MGSQKTLATKLLSWLIAFYRKAVSPFFGPSCRFVPTCSTYAQEALQEHGVRALPMIAGRLCRCHPFSSNEFQYDPVCKSGVKDSR